MNEALLQRLAKPLLILATLIWGGSFVVMKHTLDSLPVLTLLAFRFLAACVILSLLFIRRWKAMDRQTLGMGCVMGLLLFLAYTAQSYGLAGTTPGKNAFLTAVYCVIVPFLSWLLFRSRPDRYNLAAAFLCIGGIGLVSLDGAFSISRGDALTLLCGFFYAAHILSVSHFSRQRDIFLLTTIQFGASGLLALAAAVVLGVPVAPPPPQAWQGLAYLTLAATCGALLFQNVGQTYTTPAAASVLLSLEAPFGVLFSVLLYGERPTVKMLLGFALIFAAVVCSETRFEFLKKGRNAEADTAPDASQP